MHEKKKGIKKEKPFLLVCLFLSPLNLIACNAIQPYFCPLVLIPLFSRKATETPDTRSLPI